MKKVFFMAAVIAAATVNVLMMSNDKSDLSALQMENIEALAQSECSDPHAEVDRPCCTSLCGCCDYGYAQIDGRFI